MKKKILIVNNNMNIGGVQKSLINLLHEISELYDVTLLLFSTNGIYFKDIPNNVKVIKCRSWYKYFGISQDESRVSLKDFVIRGILALCTRIFGRGVVARIIGLTQPIIDSNYDVAISYLHSGNIKNFYGGCNEFVVYKVKATKKITFLHGDYEKCGANNPISNRLYSRFDCVAACSKGCQFSLLKVLPNMREKCVVIPNCHDFVNIKKLSETDTLSYEKNNINIITIARLSEEKGIERAIQAFSTILNKLSINIVYHIVGDGPKRDGLKKLVRDLELDDNVKFYGDQSNPYKFLRNADLLLITSYHEAAPLVIDEAKCLGVPIFSTLTSSAYDMIVDRNIGWVCENSQNSINDLLLEILNNPDQLKIMKKNIMNQENTNSIAIEAFNALLN